MNFEMMTIDNVNIEIERKPIKNLHLAVYPPEGRVHVSSPKQWSDEDIRSFVISRWDWVSSQRKEIINQARQTHREYVDGESHYILGVKYRLEVKFANVTPSIEIHGGVITITVRPDATEEKRAEVMREYMRSLLKDEIADMIESGNIDEAKLKEIEDIDNCFPDIDYRVYQSITEGTIPQQEKKLAPLYK